MKEKKIAQNIKKKLWGRRTLTAAAKVHSRLHTCRMYLIRLNYKYYINSTKPIILTVSTQQVLDNSWKLKSLWQFISEMPIYITDTKTMKTILYEQWCFFWAFGFRSSKLTEKVTQVILYQGQPTIHVNHNMWLCTIYLLSSRQIRVVY